jgi:anti-sigma-K factor RskA
MTGHLRQDEFIDAIEHRLDAARQAHLDTCTECRANVHALDMTLQDVRSVEQPEPSPLFWDHFSERVRAATALETPETNTPWWHPDVWLKPAGVVAAAVAAALLLLVLRPAPSKGELPTTESAALVAAPDDGSWGLVIGLASELDAADVREVAKPSEGTADAMIAELTAAQRRALAQLLKDEIGDH